MGDALQYTDIGHGHRVARIVNAAGVLCGLVDAHPDAREPGSGKTCHGSIGIATPESGEGERWRLVSEDPLTLEPSLLCTVCGDHGWVRDGAWVPA